jgi:hypothetical protein
LDAVEFKNWPTAELLASRRYVRFQRAFRRDERMRKGWLLRELDTGPGVHDEL